MLAWLVLALLLPAFPSRAPARWAPQAGALALQSKEQAPDAELVRQKFVRASQSGAASERSAALAELLALGEARAFDLVHSELARVGSELRRVQRELRELAINMDWRRIQAKNLELQLKQDPDVKVLLERARKTLEELEREHQTELGKESDLAPWKEELAVGAVRLLEAAGPARRRKLEAGLWKDAREHPDLEVRIGAIGMLGRIGAPGTALELQKLIADAGERGARQRGKLAASMSEVRKYEKRLQEDAQRLDGRVDRSTQDQYERAKVDAAALQREISELVILAEAAAAAGGEALAAEPDGEVQKSVQTLVRAMQRAKGRARVDTLALITAARSEPVSAELLALLEVESEPLARAEIIDGLAARGEQRLVAPLIERHLKDPNWHVRSRSAAALARLRSVEGIPALIDCLEREQGRQVSDVVAALCSLTGRNLHSNVDTWRRFWKENGEGFVVPPDTRTYLQEGLESLGMTFFGIHTQSQRVLLVLDVSGSMDFALTPRSNPDDDPSRPSDRPEKGELSRLEAAKIDLVKALGGLRDGATFNLILYASDVWSWSEQLTTMGPKVRAELLAHIDGLKALGGTNIYGGLAAALDMAGATGGGTWSEPKVDTIFLLSDGRPSVGVTIDREEILAFVRERNRNAGIVIHTIGVSGAHDANLMRRLAEENGGTYVAR